MKTSNSENVKLGDWIFHPLQLTDKKLYEEYMRNTVYFTDEFSWNFTWLWIYVQTSRTKVLWKLVDNMFITFVQSRKDYLYLWALPLGNGTADQVVETLYKCMQYCCHYNRNRKSVTMVNRINDKQIDFLSTSKNFYSYFKLQPLQGVERYFGIQNLITLSGKQYSNIRNHISRFKTNYPTAVIRRSVHQDYPQLLHLKKSWNTTARKKYQRITDDLRYRKLIAHAYRLDHLILVAEIDHTIVGMISAGVCPSGHCWSYFLKTDLSIGGLSETLIIHLAQALHTLYPSAEYINMGNDPVEDDTHSFKQKFRPVLSLKKYRLYLL